MTQRLLTIRTREPGTGGRESIEVRRDHIIVSPAADLASQVVDNDEQYVCLRSAALCCRLRGLSRSLAASDWIATAIRKRPATGDSRRYRRKLSSLCEFTDTTLHTTQYPSAAYPPEKKCRGERFTKTILLSLVTASAPDSVISSAQSCPSSDRRVPSRRSRGRVSPVPGNRRSRTASR